MLTIGLMSGTSADGVEAALLETDGDATIEELGHISVFYTSAFQILLKAAEYAVRHCYGDIVEAKAYYSRALHDYLFNELKTPESQLKDTLVQLTQYLHPQPLTLDTVIQHSTQLHKQAVEQLLGVSKYRASDIDVIGYHGQALFHQPDKGISVIVGDGQALANETGITVVNDFRSNDIAAGGQGAPFAPLYHQALARRDQKIPLAVVNCGGIANITVIRNQQAIDLIGFDTGPGNALVDRLVRQRTQGAKQMDMNGQYGQQGQVHESVLKALYKKSIQQQGKNYFTLLPPKSLDSGDMQLIPELDVLSLADACRTLEAFTADSIVQSLQLIDIPILQHWILAGGGWHNPVILAELKQRLRQKIGTDILIQTADEAGWNTQALEAQIFAYLAVRSLQGKPLSVPGTTRVSKPLSGGRIYRPV